MTHTEIQPWLFAIAPLPGESLSHFLGRFRGKMSNRTESYAKELIVPF